MNNKNKLSHLLGSYIDYESDIFYKIYNMYDNGLKFKIEINQIDLFNGLNANFFDIIEEQFTIIDSNTKIRGFLNKPFLFIDEDYIFEFYTENYNLNFEFRYSELTNQNIKIILSKNNFLLLQEALNNGYFYLKIIRKNSGQLINHVIQKEFLNDSNLYANNLKKSIYDSFYNLSSIDLKKERLKLWGLKNLEELNDYDILLNDFGIKNLQHLLQIYIHFKFSISNKKLIDLDKDFLNYQNSLEFFFKVLKKNNLSIKIK